MSSKFRIRIDRQRCKGCGLCVDACAREVLAMSRELNERGERYAEVVAPQECIGCRRCSLMCPECGVEVIIEEAPDTTDEKRPENGG